MARIPGVISADLNFASGTLLVEYDRAADPRDAVVREVVATGHGILALDSGESAKTPDLPWYEKYRSEIAVYGSGAFSALGGVLTLLHAPSPAPQAAYGLAVVFGGALVWRRAWIAVSARSIDMNVLMTIAVLGAIGLGEWGEAATVTFLFSLGGYLEARALERTRSSIRNLMSLAPEIAHVRRDGAVVEVPIAQVVPAETVVVRPGERVPFDGDVTGGSSAVDEAAITGESVPVDKAPGASVFAGSLNASGVLEVTVTAVASESTLARIVYLVEEAQAAKAPLQQLVDRFTRWYTPAAVGLAAAIAIVPPLLGMGSFAEWFGRGLVVLVVACPCALVISTPVAIVSAISRAGRDGVLVKGGAFLELAAKVRAVALDKTGTLTVGRPEVQAVHAESGDTRDMLCRAASLEADSTHPLALAVMRAARAMPNFALAPVAGFEDLPGRGVGGTIFGELTRLVSPSFAEEIAEVSADMAERIDAQEAVGRTVLVFVCEGTATGFVALADEMRASVPETMRALRADGIRHIAMLTGDNERSAAAVAALAGLTEHMSQLLPAGKVEAVGRLRERWGTVAMVGDGINDAPALAAADIGIAMGAAGSDTALETADVALMADDLGALPDFFHLGRRTVRNIQENVSFSVLVKVVVLVLAIVGRATLWMAVFADTGVALLVILNGMRLLAPRRRR